MFKKNHTGIALTVLKILILLAALGVFAFGAVQMYGYTRENQQSDAGRDALADKAVTVLDPDGTMSEEDFLSGLLPPPTGDGVLGEVPSNLSRSIPISVDFDVLQEENPDIVGWIYCKDTPINYPVVQGQDNQYYVHHLTDGSYNAGGAIFLDFRNSDGFQDYNSLIYGHNMRNKSMFGTLENYKKQEYYDEHPVIWLLTRECAYRINLFAGFVTPADSQSYTLFESREALDSYLTSAVQKSTFQSRVEQDTIDRIVTLSTCSYEYNAARYIVIGSLVSIPYANS